MLAARLINHHPLPGGNKRVGSRCALEFVARNGRTWTHRRGHVTLVAAVLVVVATASSRRGQVG